MLCSCLALKFGSISSSLNPSGTYHSVRDHHPNLEGKTNEYICLYTYISLRAGHSLKVKVCLGFVELIFVLFRVVLGFVHVCFRVYLGLFMVNLGLV